MYFYLSIFVLLLNYVNIDKSRINKSAEKKNEQRNLNFYLSAFIEKCLLYCTIRNKCVE